MKRAALILAALAAILTATAAPVRTATENFVTNKIAEAVAAIPAPDYSTDNAALVETIGAVSPRTSLAPATNYTDEVAAYKRGVKDLAVYGGYAPWNVQYFPEPAQWKPEIGYWEAADYEWGDFWYFRWKSGVWEFYNTIYPDETDQSKQPDDVSTNGEYALSVHFPNSNITITRTSIYATNGAHLVTSEDIAPIVTNTVTKAYVEGLGIEAGISAATATNIAQSALGDFAATGTVENANYTFHATEAGEAEALTDFDTGETRYAFRIIPVIDESASTNYANTAAANAVANADTTYRRTIGITNINQSVQYVNISDTAPTTLAISMPTDGATKDWIVYVVSVTNVSLVLPSATWWMADVAYTNDVPPATPTALWFSQVTDGIFILGRQELTEVTTP